MKKSFIIILISIYLASIIFIGFFGIELSSYEQSFYVEQIVITNDDYNQETNRITVMYESYDPEIDPYNPNTIQLDWRIYPENATIRGVSFTSDTARATVNNIGIITFHNRGTAKITIRSTDGSDVQKSLIVWFQ